MEDEPPNEWVVVEDPYNHGRMLVGCFIAGRVSRDSRFQWSEIGKGEILSNLPSDIFDRPRGHLCFELVGNSLLCWRKDIGEFEWNFLGLASIVTGKGGSVAILRALKLEPFAYDESEQPTNWDTSSIISLRVSKALRKIIHVQKQAKSVIARLSPLIDKSEVQFVSSENEKIIAEIELEATGDLIHLLTIPSREGKPIWLNSKTSVKWNCFKDIEYGPLEILRPFIETSAPYTIKKPLPPRI